MIPALLALLLAAPAAAETGYAGPLPLTAVATPEDAPALACDAGRCRAATVGEARADGYTVVDMGDTWAPRVFAHAVDTAGRRAENRYRGEYLRLAGDPDRWLEVYGVSPTLSNVLGRWRAARARACYADVDWEALRSFEGRITVNRKDAKVWKRRARKGGRAAEVFAALVAAQRRLACDGLYAGMKLREGWADGRTKRAVLRFNKRHRIFAGGSHIEDEVLEALAAGTDETFYAALQRALEERVADAAGEIEDGSAKGSEDRVGAARDAFLRAVGVGDPASALAWLQGLGDLTGERYLAARLPSPSPGYGTHMQLAIEIDRGDVWYDHPYDAEGSKIGRRVRRRPKLRLWSGEGADRRPLIRWRTTIGGWRKEQLGDGYTYIKYKLSPVGRSLMRRVVAAPVWVPPESTPLRSLVRWDKARGVHLNYEEMGPGYGSAYGLVAGYLLACGEEGGRPKHRCRQKDRGIRIHGTSEWLSVLGAYSHGCHRLFNHLALRLYGFILAHRVHGITGQVLMDYTRTLEWRPPGKPDAKVRELEISLDTRGFRYELSPPVPVTVHKGRVRGDLDEPDEDYHRIPTKDYGEDAWVPPEGGSGEPPLVVGDP